MKSRAMTVGLGMFALGAMALAQQSGSPPKGDGDSLIRDFAGERAFTKPSKDSVMGFSMPTQVGEVFVKGGQEVKKGDKLVRGDDTEDLALLRLQKIQVDSDLPVQRAKVEMDLKKLGYDNVLEAKSRGGSSPQEEDTARLAYEGARLDWENARLNQTTQQVQFDRLKARVDRLTLSAPFDGQVDSVAVEVGQAVSENEKVVRVVDIDPLWIDVPATMRDVTTLKVKKGDKAWVLVEVAGVFSIRPAAVIEVSPVADPGSRTRRVRVEMQNPIGDAQLVAGEPAWVRFTDPGERVKARVGGNATTGDAASPVAAPVATSR